MSGLLWVRTGRFEAYVVTASPFATPAEYLTLLALLSRLEQIASQRS